MTSVVDTGTADQSATGQSGQMELPHGEKLQTNALSLIGNIGLDVGSSAVTASMAVTIGAIVAVSGYASPIAILICGLPMLAIAAAYRQLNKWRVHCGATYDWGARSIGPPYGFMVGWIIWLAYVVGAVSIIIPLGPYFMSFVGNANSRLGEAVIGFVGTVVVVGVALIGVRISARVQWTLLAIELIGIAILVVYALVAMTNGTHGAVGFTPSWFSWHEMGGVGGFVSAALISVYIYSGWDTGMLLNEETGNPRRWPGAAVMISVVALGLVFALLTFSFQAIGPIKGIESHSDVLEYIAHRLAGGWLAKWIVLGVALSALGSTLACVVSAARMGLAMGSDGVFPRVMGRTSKRFKTPVAATIVVGVLAAAGSWVYPLGSSSVQTSFTRIVSVDGMLFGLFYAGTGIAVAVYYRRLAVKGVWRFVSLEIFPLVSAAFLLYVDVKSAATNGWGSGTMVSLYVMLGIGICLLAYGYIARTSDFFRIRREAYDPSQDEEAMLALAERQPVGSSVGTS